MAQIFNKTFDGGTDGALATSEYSNASGLFDYSATAAAHGGMGVRIRTNNSIYGVASFTAKTKSYDQFYLHLPTALAGTGSFFKYRQGTVPVLELRRYANGDFDIRNGYTQAGSRGTGLPATGVVRFLVHCDTTGAAGTHQMEVRAFHGANLENPNPDGYDSRALATGLTGYRTSWDSSTLGGLDANAYAILVGWDSHSMDDATWPAPVNPPVVTNEPTAFLKLGGSLIPLGGAAFKLGESLVPLDSPLIKTGGPAALRTVFGANVGPVPPYGQGGASQNHTQAVQQHTDLMGAPPILRSFLQGIPSTWAGTGDNALLNDWEGRWSWVSFKPGIATLATNSLHQDIVNYVTSIPITGMKRMLTVHHEPENDGKSNTALQYHNAYRNFAASVQSVGHPDVLVGPIFMGYSNIYSSGAGWGVNEIVTAGGGAAELDAVWDFIGWDPYYETSQLGTFNPSNAGDWYLQRCADYTTETFTNKPMAIGETGATNNTTTINGYAPLAYRPWMMLDFEAWCLANGNVLAACYFDNTGGNVPWWIRVYTSERGSQSWPSSPYPVDQGSIDAWAGVYSRTRAALPQFVG